MPEPEHTAEVVPSLLQPRSGKPKPFGIGREQNDKPRYDAAKVALLAGEHVPEAIRTIAELVTSADRDSVRLKAATTMVELACGIDPSDGNEGVKTYVLVTANDSTATQSTTNAISDELIKRLGK